MLTIQYLAKQMLGLQRGGTFPETLFFDQVHAKNLCTAFPLALAKGKANKMMFVERFANIHTLTFNHSMKVLLCLTNSMKSGFLNHYAHTNSDIKN